MSVVFLTYEQANKKDEVSPSILSNRNDKKKKEFCVTTVRPGLQYKALLKGPKMHKIQADVIMLAENALSTLCYCERQNKRASRKTLLLTVFTLKVMTTASMLIQLWGRGLLLQMSPNSQLTLSNLILTS